MTDTANAVDIRPLRVGVIGAGNHSRGQLYPCLPTLPVQLVAVCDLNESLARERARQYGAEAVYTDHRRMFDRASLDAVLICVGPEAHSTLAIEAMQSGYPVYTEKPPAANAEAAYLVLETSRRTGQICMTGFMKRFAPVFRRAHEVIQSGEFGAPSLLRIDWSLGVQNERFIKSFLLDFGIHHIDLARFLFGEVKEVYARAQGDRTYAIMFAFENGAVGTLTMSVNRGLELVEDVGLTGGFGHFISIDRTGRMTRWEGERVLDFKETPLAFRSSHVDIGYYGELSEFLSAVREGRTPESSIDSSYRTMILHEAIVRSLAEGAITAVADLEEGRKRG